MPIDPSIPLGIRPVQTPSPLETVSAVTQLMGLREQVEQRRLAADQARQQAKDAAAIRQVLTETNGDVEAALPRLRMIAPAAALDFEKSLNEGRTQKFNALKGDLEYRGKRLDLGLKVAQSMQDAPSYRAGRPMVLALSPELEPLLPEEYDPESLQRVLDMGLSAKEVHDRKMDGLKLFTEGKAAEGLATFLSTARDADEWDKTAAAAIEMGVPKALVAQFGSYSPENVQRAATIGITPKDRATMAASAHSPGYKEWQDYQAAGGALGFNDYQTMDANRRRAITRINTGQGSDADVDEMLSGMMDGTLPPLLPGRASPLYTKIMGAAHRRGFDLASAATDWVATQKHTATMNGAQQLRLNQAVNALPAMLDKVDSLASQWDAGRFPALNRANLALAKGGALGTKAATIANELEAQIADVVADLGNVYMGGNSPTDHALSLAQKSLSADWSAPVLKQMVALAKQNVQIRQNSIKNTGVAGASADNPYMPDQNPPPVAVPPPVAAALAGVGPGRHTLSDGSKWEKRADGSIVKVP